MTLREFCHTLPETKQIELAVDLTRHALPVWNEYAQHNSLSYHDTVVGLNHVVPKQLLTDSINEVELYVSVPKILREQKRKERLLKLYSYFSDPVIALQDTDWELPMPVQKTFYSIYNLLAAIVDDKKTTYGDSTIYVSINQAIEAIELSNLLSEAEISKIIEQAGEDR